MGTEMATDSTRVRVNAARVIAVLADCLQLMVFPVFVEGYLSPLEDALDVIVGGLMCALLGFHWSFLPSFIAKLVPGLDLIPTWTAAVFLVTGVGPGKAAPSVQTIDVPAVTPPAAEPPRLEPPAAPKS